MNKTRREEAAAIQRDMDELRRSLEDLLAEEQESFDNLPDSLQQSERGETMEGYIDSIQSSIDSLDDAYTYIGEVLY